MLQRCGSSVKSARCGGDREDDDDGNGFQGYRAAMKGGRFHYSASIECVIAQFPNDVTKTHEY